MFFVNFNKKTIIKITQWEFWDKSYKELQQSLLNFLAKRKCRITDKSPEKTCYAGILTSYFMFYKWLAQINQINSGLDINIL